MSTYTIPERNIGWLREKVEKLNKRAERLDVRPVELTVVREEFRPHGVRGEVRKYFVVEVIGERGRRDALPLPAAAHVIITPENQKTA